jgi:cysteine synthase A
MVNETAMIASDLRALQPGAKRRGRPRKITSETAPITAGPFDPNDDGTNCLHCAWIARQFDNPANPDIHACTTAEEIWRDTAGEVDAVVGGIGTGGTLTGIARTLKPRKPGLRVIGVEPAESAVLNGDEPGPHLIQGIGAGFRPGVLELDSLDGVERVAERDAFAAARAVAKLDGVPVGISTGAVLAAMMRIARQPGMEGKLIVGIAASSAERYLSTNLFEGL